METLTLHTNTGVNLNLYVEVSSTIDIPGNYSLVTVKTYLRHSSLNAVARSDSYITVNGEKRVYSTPKIAYTNSQGVSGIIDTTLGSETFKVYHNGDGTKSITLDVGYIWSGNYNGTQIGTLQITRGTSNPIVLDTIPRTTPIDSVTCSTTYLDGTITVKYTPKATFNHKLRLSIPNVVAIKTIDLGSQGTGQKSKTATFTSTELTSIYRRYPSTTSVTIGAVIETWSGTTKIGESTEETLSLTMPTSVKPTVSATITEDNYDVSSKVSVYVKGISRLHVKASGSGAYGSTIANYSIEVNGTKYNSDDITTNALKSVGSQKVKITVTDSRNRSNTAEYTIMVYDYSKPTISSLEAYRATSDGTASDNGYYAKIAYNASISSVNGLNSANYKLEYKVSGATNWTQSYSVNSSATSYSKTTILSNIDVDNTYDVRITISDLFGETVTEVPIETEFVLIDYHRDGKGIAFGKVSEGDGLDIALETVFRRDPSFYRGNSKISLLDYIWPVGAVYTAMVNTNPSTFLGGIWESVNNMSGAYMWRRTK